MAKFTALAVGAKAAIVAGAIVVTAAGVGVPVYVHTENVKTEQAAIVEQQRVEQVQAEAAAQEAADKIAAEQVAKAAEEKAATEKAEKAAAEEAEQQKAAEAAEAAQAEKAAQEAEAATVAQAATEQPDTATAQEQADEPIPNEGSSSSAPIKGTPPPGNSKSDAAGLPSTSGGGVRQTEEEVTKEVVDYKGKQWVGKEEPAKSETVQNKMRGDEWSWDSSVGGWRSTRNQIIFPNGDHMGI